MIYCVIPRELEGELYEKMVEYYKDNPNVTVIVDRREGEDRRKGRVFGGKREIRDRRSARAGHLPGDRAARRRLVSYWVKRLDEVPLVPTDDPDDFDCTRSTSFGLGAFGANAFGGAAGTSVVAEHDERKSGQEELYVVIRGAARFMLNGEKHDMRAISVVAIPDPEVRRAAVATEDGTIVLAVGAPADSGFATTWNPANFGQLPQAD